MLWFNKDQAEIKDAKHESEIKDTDADDLERTRTETTLESEGYRGEAQVKTVAQRAKVDAQVLSEEAQAGVRKIEAVTLTWTKRDLIIAYVL